MGLGDCEKWSGRVDEWNFQISLAFQRVEGETKRPDEFKSVFTRKGLDIYCPGLSDEGAITRVCEWREITVRVKISIKNDIPGSDGRNEY